MSFYNILFGSNNLSHVLLATIGLTVNDVPRFRDCYLMGDKIVIYTRTGGGNREEYDSENSDLVNNPYYHDDYDDDFDSTYAYFEFNFPDKFKNDLKAMSEKQGDYSPSKNWKHLIESLQ